MRTLIIIPAYNEQDNIKRVVDDLTQNYPLYDYIVINDGSKDKTAQICKENGYNMLDLPVNLGLAGAFQAGMKYAYKNNYDAALQFDADGQHRGEYIKAMEDKMAQGYDIVIGSRFVSEKKPLALRMLGSRIISYCIFLTTFKKITDPTSGMRLYSRRVIKRLANNINCAPEPDTISFLIKRGAKISEVQVTMDERIAGKSYLTLTKSVAYMLRISLSIIVVQWFRGGKSLEKEQN